MNSVSIKDFHVGKPAWSIERQGNTEKIVEQSVINVGRKYVTVLRMERKYSELPGGGAYLSDRASRGYDSWLFPTEQSAKEFIQKKDLILKLRKKIDHISSFGEEYTLADLKKVYEILNNEKKEKNNMNRKEEIAQVKQLGEAIGYGNLMDIASGLWALKEGNPCHMPSVKGFMTEEGEKVALQQLDTRLTELKKLGY